MKERVSTLHAISRKLAHKQGSMYFLHSCISNVVSTTIFYQFHDFICHYPSKISLGIYRSDKVKNKINNKYMHVTNAHKRLQ